MAPDVSKAMQMIDAAHAEDPNKIEMDDSLIPYELHYAQKCTKYLEKHTSNPSPLLTTAVRAQVCRLYTGVPCS